MTDEQNPAVSTRLERAVHEFLRGEYPHVTLGPSRLEVEYAIVPDTAIEALRRAIDPERPTPRPFVSHDPAMKGGSAVLNGTRLTVEAVASVVWDGWDEAKIRRDGWDYLTRGDVLVAAWFMAMHGSRIWRRRWQAWAIEIAVPLSRARTDEDYASIAWPPSRDGEGRA